MVRPLGPRLDLSHLPTFFDQVVKLARAGEKRLVLDFSEVEWVSTSIAGFLIIANKEIHDTGAELRLSGLGNRLASTLEIFNIAKSFRVFSHPEEAVQSFGNSTQV